MKKQIVLTTLFCSLLSVILVACCNTRNASSENSLTSSTPSAAQNNVVGTLTDTRDGQVYKTVQIGEQVWMAENLNYKAAKSNCWGQESACAEFGRLYTWAGAMDSVGAFSSNAKNCGMQKECFPTDPVQGVCPVGWHLPTREEWKTLLEYAGDKGDAAKVLKSQTGWWSSHKGSDDFGFSAIPGGGIFHYWFRDNGQTTYFWSSTEFDAKNGYNLSLNDNVVVDEHPKNSELYVRCIKDFDRREIKEEKNAIPASEPESMTDPRDGQTYKTVKIGSQTWMAENLNYKTKNSKCWLGDSVCVNYGRSYSWDDAKKACPAGWRMPNSEDWFSLFSSVGGRRLAGKVFKTTFGWSKGGDGSDEYGFSVRSTGLNDGDEIVKDGDADFWIDADDNPNHLYTVLFKYNRDNVEFMARERYAMSSIRCVKGSDRREIKEEKNAIPASEPEPMTDPRDGQTYKTVTIGSQTWMAENLNFKTRDSSYCYGNDANNCVKFGRLYLKHLAMDVCPVGWHLPTPTEWEQLISVLKGRFLAGNKLKSVTGWVNGENGTDDYGFNASPAGVFNPFNIYHPLFSEEGVAAYFWSSEELSDNSTYYVKLEHGLSNITFEVFDERTHKIGFSVRCVKD